MPRASILVASLKLRISTEAAAVLLEKDGIKISVFKEPIDLALVLKSCTSYAFITSQLYFATEKLYDPGGCPP